MSKARYLACSLSLLALISLAASPAYAIASACGIGDGEMTLHINLIAIVLGCAAFGALLMPAYNLLKRKSFKFVSAEELFLGAAMLSALAMVFGMRHQAGCASYFLAPHKAALFCAWLFPWLISYFIYHHFSFMRGRYYIPVIVVILSGLAYCTVSPLGRP